MSLVKLAAAAFCNYTCEQCFVSVRDKTRAIIGRHCSGKNQFDKILIKSQQQPAATKILIKKKGERKIEKAVLFRLAVRLV